jgi:hypothetical protein
MASLFFLNLKNMSKALNDEYIKKPVTLSKIYITGKSGSNPFNYRDSI